MPVAVEADPELQANLQTSGDQAVQSSAAVAAMPTGAFVAFRSPPSSPSPSRSRSASASSTSRQQKTRS